MQNDSFNICLNISTIDGSVVVSPSPSTSTQLPSESCSKPVEKVFIYDIDALTMLSKKTAETIKQVLPGIRVDLALAPIERNLSKYNLDNDWSKKVVNISNVVKDGADGSNEMVAKYDLLKSQYNTISDLWGNGMPRDEPHLKLFFDRWRCAKRFLRLINESHNYANVVLTEDGVAYGANQLIRSALLTEVPIENIYSTGARSTKDILEIIKERFGGSCQLVIVTSNVETMNAARQVSNNHAVWTIHCDEDWNKLYNYECNFRLQAAMDDNVE